MPVIIGSIPIMDIVDSNQMPAENGLPSYNATPVIMNQPVAPNYVLDANAPLLPPVQMPPLPYPSANAASAPALPQPNFPSAPMFNDNDPPTYEEATHVANASGDDKAKKNFNPKYPMFRRNTSYSSNN